MSATKADAKCNCDERASSARGTPARVALRPDPAQWSGTELMSLQEAAALFWPLGLLTTTSLRTAVRDQILEVVVIAGKILTSKDCVEKMSRCGVRASPVEEASTEVAPVTAGKRMPSSVAEYRHMVAQGLL